MPQTELPLMFSSVYNTSYLRRGLALFISSTLLQSMQFSNQFHFDVDVWLGSQSSFLRNINLTTAIFQAIKCVNFTHIMCTGLGIRHKV